MALFLFIDSINPDDVMSLLGATVTTNIINIGTKGYHGTGKTSILNLSVGKDPAPQRNTHVQGCITIPCTYRT